MAVAKKSQRAQLILITAVLVALVVVGAVVLLNAIHESPQINAQTEAQSATDTQRTAEQIRGDLEGVFQARTSVNQTGEPMPYAYQFGGGPNRPDDRDFDEDIEGTNGYSDNYATLRTTHSQTVINVDYTPSNEGGSLTGAVAFQNDSSKAFTLPAEGPLLAGSQQEDYVVVEDAEMIPRFFLNISQVSSGEEVRFLIDGTGGTDELVIDDSSVTRNSPTGANDWTCGGGADDLDLDGTGSVAVDFTDGVGEVRGDDVYCGNLTFGAELDPQYDVEVESGATAFGNYTITANVSSATSDIKSQSPTSNSPDRAQFDVDEFDITSPSGNAVLGSDTIVADVNISNSGSNSDTQYVTLENDSGFVMDHERLTLSSGSFDDSIQLEWQPNGTNAFGNTDLAVRTVNDVNDSQDINIVGPPPGNVPDFAVNITEPDPLSPPTTVTAGETLNITANVSNVGTANDTQTIYLNNTWGNVTDDVEVTGLSPSDGNETVTLQWDVPRNSDLWTAGPQDIRVNSQDDVDTLQVDVQPPDPPIDRNPYFYDEDTLSQTIVVNPRFSINVTDPDISYTNEFYLYNRTEP